MPWSDEQVEAAAGQIALADDCNDGRMCAAPLCHCRQTARAALSAADAVRGRTHVVVPREPTDEMVAVAARFQGGYDPIDMRQLLRDAIAAGDTHD